MPRFSGYILAALKYYKDVPEQERPPIQQFIQEFGPIWQNMASEEQQRLKDRARTLQIIIGSKFDFADWLIYSNE